MHGAGVAGKDVEEDNPAKKGKTGVVHQSRNRMTPNDSLQLPVSRPLFDKPGNLICRDRDGTSNVMCICSMFRGAEHSDTWGNYQGVTRQRDNVYEEGNLLAGFAISSTL